MKTIGEILEKNNSILSKLIKKTNDTRSLELVFQSVLDASLVKNCQFASLEGSIVTISVKNASWATRVRYSIPDMLKNMRTQPEFKNITSIRYIVSRHQISTEKIKKKQIKLSQYNEVLLKKMLAKLKQKAIKTSNPI